MKTMKLLFLSLLMALPAMAEDEYSEWEVQLGSFGGFNTTVPVDLTKEECSGKILYQGIMDKVWGAEILTRVVFRGYNPGGEILRHVRLWVNNVPSNSSKNNLAFEGDCVIPGGGSESEPIPLLSLDMCTPLSPSISIAFQIECTGEAAEEPVCFECDEYNHPVVMLTLASGTACLQGSISDQDGNPVSGAAVSVYNDQAGLEYKASTDSEGRYSVRVERAGYTYNMRVTADGYAEYDVTRPFRGYGNYMPDSRGVSIEKDIVLFSRIEYTADKLATIILPTNPDPSLGRYYQPAYVESNTVYFGRVETPRANSPYVIFPNEDFSINVADYDLSGMPEPEVIMPAFPDESAPRPKTGFYGTYTSQDIWIDYCTVFDDTPDCVADRTKMPRAGAFRCYFFGFPVSNPTFDAMKCVFVGEQTGIDNAICTDSDAAPLFDLQGRRVGGDLQSPTGTPTRGLYIRDGRKYVVR